MGLEPLSAVTTAVLVPMLVAALVAISTFIYDRSRKSRALAVQNTGLTGTRDRRRVGGSRYDQQDA